MSPRKRSSFKLNQQPNNSATEATLASTDFAKRKKVDTRVSETQTSPQKQGPGGEKSTITAEDLTSEANPGALYWEHLAEKRRVALEETLTENQHLHERIEGLEAELDTSRQMLDEARNLVEVLTEMLNENEAEREIESDGGVTGGEAHTETAGNTLDDDDNSNTSKSSAEPPITSEDRKRLEHPHTP
ncbi:PREDICTED: geminin isoform X2 [Rhagoletis zephyria]|uniref:geminin isoform X2 n=1 Tax=Rhagoletis zephyria TaxID=28612 RepID=UPI000811465D|nr:PREDICTED: geminin isoform X2 [Rhagoletis zephyria]XP_036319075.1 geminin isoform X2 [Rhagoletis pomonella]